jgi:hypothetical protein
VCARRILQLVIAIMGFWFVVYKGVKALMPDAKPAPASAAAVTTGGDIPSADSPSFESWIDAPGNAEKWFNNLAK